MNKKRRFILHLMPALIMSGIVGCASRKQPGNKQYEEYVSSVLISDDGTKLIVMTTDYHYIFEGTQTLINALKGKFHHRLTAEFDEFNLKETDDIRGMVTLSFNGGTDEEKQAALNAGFTKNLFGIKAKVALIGVRYNSNNVHPSSQYKLNQTYKIKVNVERSYNTNTRISSESPITVVGKGALMLLGTALVLPFLVFNCTTDDNCLK